MTSTSEVLRLVDDWTAAVGARVQICREGEVVCEGIADAVTEDGGILWVRRDNDARKLFLREEHYEVSVLNPADGLNYRISKGAAASAAQRS